MVKADLNNHPVVMHEDPAFVHKVNDVPVVVDVALVPMDSAAAGPVIDVQLVPLPPGYLPWLDSLRANAHYGSDALARAWYISPVVYHQHLLTVAPDLWLTLKAIARRAA